MEPLVFKTPSRKTKTTAVILPTRESSRKRVRKSLGPDFIEDFAAPAKPQAELIPIKLKIPKPKPFVKPIQITVVNSQNRGQTAKEIPAALDAVNGKVSLIDEAPPVVKREAAPVPAPICRVCNTVIAASNGETGPTMLRCGGRNCSYTVHVECLSYSKETISVIKDRFRCLDCKRCCTCGKGNAAVDKNLILCSRCDVLFHLRCNVPPVDPNSEELKGRSKCFVPNWICYRCKAQAELNKPPPEAFQIVTVAVTNEQISLAKSIQNGLGCLLKNGKETDGRITTIYAPEALPIMKVSVSHDYEDMISGAVPGPSTYGNLLKGKLSAEEYNEWMPSKGADSGRSPSMDDLQREEEREKLCRHRCELAKWSYEQCACHFDDSSPRLAELIRSHRLHGSSLVVIRRKQFMDMFGLTLGVALKLHYAVCEWRKSFF